MFVCVCLRERERRNTRKGSENNFNLKAKLIKSGQVIFSVLVLEKGTRGPRAHNVNSPQSLKKARKLIPLEGHSSVEHLGFSSVTPMPHF